MYRSKVDNSRAARDGLWQLMSGFQAAALIHVAAKLGIADLLAGGQKSSEELAAATATHPGSLHRVLRALAALGVLSEDDAGFGLTPLGQDLRKDVPGSLYAHAVLLGEEWLPLWGQLLTAVKTGDSVYERVFGAGKYEYRAAHPELNVLFNQSRAELAVRETAAIIDAYDFSPFQTITDIGGGNGTVIAAVLQASPEAKGILFDQPHVVAGAPPVLETAGVAARCEVVPGSFFEEVPAAADLYILKGILPDWNDEHSLTILQTCGRAMAGKGTLLVIDPLLPDRAEQAPVPVFSDIQMMLMGDGRNRTQHEFRDLLGTAGFEVQRIVATGSRFSLIETVPALSQKESP